MVGKQKVKRSYPAFSPDLSSLNRRRPIEWGIRCALALVLGFFGFFAVMQSFAMSIDSPESAHKLDPKNSFLMSKLSASLSGTGATRSDRARSDRLARLALLGDPTAVDAVATLGENAQIRGNSEYARRLFGYAQQLSRHDLRTQGWAIQDAGVRGSVADTLKHYDIILRTSPNTTDVLYPALASAVSNPRIRAALVETLSHQPRWAQDFIGYIGINGPDPEATASFFQALRRARVPVSNRAISDVICALINKNQFAAAWDYYVSLRKNVARGISRDPKFIADLEVPAAFDWTLSSDNNISTTIQHEGGGGVFMFSAPASVGGQMLRQIETFAPGDYVLEGQSAGIDQPTASERPYWSLTCRGGQTLGQIDLPNSNIANGRFGGRFSVPPGCPVQILSFDARPSSEIAGSTGRIYWVSLHHANRG